MSKNKTTQPETSKRAGVFVGAWFPPELVEQMDNYATRKNRDRSDILRQAVNEKLARLGIKTQEANA